MSSIENSYFADYFCKYLSELYFRFTLKLFQVYFEAVVFQTFLEFISSQTEVRMWCLGSKLMTAIVNTSSSSENFEGYQLAQEWLPSSRQSSQGQLW